MGLCATPVYASNAGEQEAELIMPAYGGKPTLRATQHFNALDALSAAIVRDVEIGLHLDH